MNPQLDLEKRIAQGQGKEKQRLLLHSCCAPCSSYVLTYLREHFAITVYYYNPNITKDQEYLLRLQEQMLLIHHLNEEGGAFIDILQSEYQPEDFWKVARDYAHCKEGGERCEHCYRLRLRKTAQMAAELGFDFFATTLTISPLKSAQKINDIGLQVGEEYQVCYLPSDFKKKDGYKKSILLSKEYQLYRQNYCGCEYSRLQMEKEKRVGE